MPPLKWERITVHCLDTKNGESVSVETVDAWHKARGWSGIGYHFLIQISGRIDEGRQLTKVGAHVEGANEGNIGIALCGRNKYTVAQFQALRQLITDLKGRYGIPPWEIYTHAQWASAIKQGKTCPNVSINRLLTYLNTENMEAIKVNTLEDV